MSVAYRDSLFPLPRVVPVPKAPADFAPKAVACKRNYGKGPCNRGIACESRDPPKCLAVDGLSAEAEPEEFAVNMDKLAAELSRNRLSEIAELVRALTYGEMIEFAKAIWNIRPNEVEPLTEETLPGVLHRWSVGR